MADIITNGTILDYVINVKNQLESGELPGYADPAPPSDLGSALTQAQIDQLKILLNEVTNRFNTGGGGAE